MRLVKLIHLFSALFFATGPLTSCTPSSTPYYYYTGTIDLNLLDQISNAWDSHGIQELRLTSLGGDVNASVALARYLNTHKIRLRIERVCFSACAGILALTVDDVVIQPDTLVALHNGPLAHASIKASRGPKGDISVIENLSALYTEKRIPLEFSILSSEALHPVCFLESEQGPVIYSQATLWVATRSELKALGVNTPPGWPEENTKTLQGILQLFEQEGKSVRVHHSVKFVGEPRVFSLRECDRSNSSSFTSAPSGSSP